MAAEAVRFTNALVQGVGEMLRERPQILLALGAAAALLLCRSPLRSRGGHR